MLSFSHQQLVFTEFQDCGIAIKVGVHQHMEHSCFLSHCGRINLFVGLERERESIMKLTGYNSFHFCAFVTLILKSSQRSIAEYLQIAEVSAPHIVHY